MPRSLFVEIIFTWWFGMIATLIFMWNIILLSCSLPDILLRFLCTLWSSHGLLIVENNVLLISVASCNIWAPDVQFVICCKIWAPDVQFVICYKIWALDAQPVICCKIWALDVQFVKCCNIWHLRYKLYYAVIFGHLRCDLWNIVILTRMQWDKGGLKCVASRGNTRSHCSDIRSG